MNPIFKKIKNQKKNVFRKNCLLVVIVVVVVVVVIIVIVVIDVNDVIVVIGHIELFLDVVHFLLLILLLLL